MLYDQFLSNDWGQTNQDFGGGQTDQVIDNALKNLTSSLQTYSLNTINLLGTLKSNLVAEDESLEQQVIMAYAKQERAEQQQTNKLINELSKHDYPAINKIVGEIETISKRNKETATETKNKILKQIRDSKLETDSDIDNSIEFINVNSGEAFGVVTDILIGLKKNTKNALKNFLTQKLNEFAQAQKIPWEGPIGIITLDQPDMEAVFGPWKKTLFDYLDSKTDFYTQQFDFVNEAIKLINNTAKGITEQNEIATISVNDAISTKKKTLVSKIKDYSMSMSVRGGSYQKDSASQKQDFYYMQEQLKEKVGELKEFQHQVDKTQQRYGNIKPEETDYLTIGAITALIAAGATAVGFWLSETAGLTSKTAIQNIKNTIQLEWFKSFETINETHSIEEIKQWGKMVSDISTNKRAYAIYASAEVSLLSGLIAPIGIALATAIAIYAGIELNIGQYAVELQDLNNKTEQEINQEADDYAKEIEGWLADANEDFKQESAKALNLIVGITLGFEKDIKKAITDYISQELNKFKPKGPGDYLEDIYSDGDVESMLGFLTSGSDGGILGFGGWL